MLNKTTLFILLFIGCSQQNEHDSVARVNGAILTKQMLKDISEKNKTLSRNEHISVWIEEELLYQADNLEISSIFANNIFIGLKNKPNYFNLDQGYSSFGNF